MKAYYIFARKGYENILRGERFDFKIAKQESDVFIFEEVQHKGRGYSVKIFGLVSKKPFKVKQYTIRGDKVKVQEIDAHVKEIPPKPSKLDLLSDPLMRTFLAIFNGDMKVKILGGELDE